jgi:outer membrane protein assembly factor BamB
MLGFRGRRGGGRFHALSGVSLVLTLSLGVLAGFSPASATAASTVAQAGAGPPKSAAYNWVELHGDNNLSGYASNSSLNTSNAGRSAPMGEEQGWSGARVSGRHFHFAGMMTYFATDDGCVLAFKVRSSQLVWRSRPLGGDIIASPVISAGALWVATQDPARLYKFNLTTGATDCTQVTPEQFFSSFNAAVVLCADMSVPEYAVFGVRQVV